MPNWAINVGICLGFASGIYILVWTLLRPPKDDSGTGRFKVLGWEFELAGRAIFQIFIAGLLISFPLLMSAVAHPTSIAPAARSFQQVDTIPDPSYAAFRFVRDDSILDLRASPTTSILNQAAFFGKKSHPANLINSMLIHKVGRSDVISFTYSTSGSLDIRCLTHRCSLRRAIQKDQHAGGVMNETWEVSADVSNVSVGNDFEIVVEATYWNAFDTAEKQWYGTYPNLQGEAETVSSIVLFPTDKPFRDFSLWSYPHGSDAGQLFQGDSKIIPSNDKLSIYWEIPNAQGNRTFEIHWTY